VLIAGLPTSHKIGLGLVALAFISFALISSFVLPRYRKDFPGKDGVAGFVAICLVFFCSMMAAVWFFGKEPKEASAGGETPTASTPAPTTTAAAPPTTSAATSTASAPTVTGATSTGATTSAPPPAPAGNAAAGKQLFTANGCAACHTFGPAGSNGKVGPDLDHLAADAQKANRGSLEQYVTESIKDPGAYVVPGYPNGVMPTFSSLTPAQVQDLVAFLTQSA
jgi:mono/diheme cytochrome c family protein